MTPIPASARKIAVRVPNWIGDVIMAVPALEQLRAAYPDAEIIAVARPWVKDLLMWRGDLINRCLDFDDKGKHKGLPGLWRFGRALAREQCDLGVVLTKHFKGAFVFAVAGIPRRIGFATPETRWFLHGALARKSLPKTGRHQSCDYTDLLAHTSNIPTPSEPLPPRLVAEDPRRDAAQAKFLADLPKPWLMVHAGAAFGTAKRWDSAGYRDVCRAFVDRTGGGVVLLGVKAEAEENTTIATGLPERHGRNLCAATSLSESLALIASADFFLSNDSGLMHAAAAFGVPQVAIFGPTDINATFPFNEKARTVYHRVDCSPCFQRHCPIGHDCMKAVKVDEVTANLAALG
ncbi:lipopolysaccharide heptosyltransferase II [Acanthopleuribacter pedis]|uniref:lipopolysaccharide heptosyltransferase II n=1 Tax=Acanthopleuribacter pedis TaxID=442870 RepID=A0A8J7QGX0_9BACT|nr:lipopolysaccharide heptosyltransferase II [Acanthopleuribacter pedis]MBO1318398.1 lipopolysaccharide heptosyltransferase II [Acanthopleuribacter pedis]